MAEALDISTDVFQGFWLDWSKGRVMGLTWTLCPTQASVLTNSITLFITVVAIQFWSIIRHALHQQGAVRQKMMDTPHLNKQQVILRNASSELATARLMLNLAWKSRRSTGKRSFRAYFIGLFALVYAVFFMLAGIFSTKAITADSLNGGAPVLVKSDRCGIWNDTYLDVAYNPSPATEEEFAMELQFTAKQAHDVQLSLEYAQECYLTNLSATSKSSKCGTLVKPKLDWEIRNGSCPFDAKMCNSKAKSVIFDTGELDSQIHLGINAKPSDRLRYRRITECAVLDGTDRIRGWNGTVTNTSTKNPFQEHARAFYGPSLYKKTDWTYSYSNFASFFDNFTAQNLSPYLVDVESAFSPTNETTEDSSDFLPIPELSQDKADVILMFLSFIGTYIEPIDDPWFSAHEGSSFNTSDPLFSERYSRDTAIGTVGCTEKHQFCTVNGACTEYAGFDQMQTNDYFNNSLSSHQNSTFVRIQQAIAFSQIGHIVSFLAATTTPLLASNVTESGGSGAVASAPLPDDQWRLELYRWHAIGMAQFQRSLLQWATGQMAPEPQYVQYVLPPIAEEDIWFCENFIIPSTFYQSFSVVSIVLIVAFGILLIVVSLSLEHWTDLLRKCFKKSKPRHHWDHDDMLGLRRRTIPNPWRSPRPPPPPKDDYYPDFRQANSINKSGSDTKTSSKSVSEASFQAFYLGKHLSPRQDQASASKNGYHTSTVKSDSKLSYDQEMAISLTDLASTISEIPMGGKATKSMSPSCPPPVAWPLATVRNQYHGAWI